MIKDKRAKGGRRNICYKCSAIQCSKHYFNNKEKIMKAVGEFNKRFPEKYYCMNKVKYYHTKNERSKTCSQCKKEGVRTDAHHDDYGYPLKFRYLCRTCHKRFHMEHVYDEYSLTFDKKTEDG